jgi:threonine dehydratase
LTLEGKNMTTSDLTLRDVYLARKRIASMVRKTRLVPSASLSELSGASVYLKLENLQETGSFKLRGATNKILSLTAEEQERGVITVSTGNHGRAVSYVARQLGVNAVICLSKHVPSNKVEALKRLGAEIIIHGQSYDEAMERATQLQEQRGLTWVDPFDDPFVIAGQGTIGLELLDDMPDIDTAVVPLSGGGLISGVALALKSVAPEIRVIGVSMDRAPVMVHSLRAGAPIEMEEEPTIADALAGGIYLDNQHTFRMVQRYVDETFLLSEQEIAVGIAFAMEQHRLVVEGGGAVGIAALLHHRVRELGQKVAVVVSGGNVDSALLATIIKGEFRP